MDYELATTKKIHKRKWPGNHSHMTISEFKTSARSTLMLYLIAHNSLHYQAPMKKQAYMDVLTT